MADKRDIVAESRGKSCKKPAKSAKSKAKSNLIDFTMQLASLGNLQQAIVKNMQKELGNLD